VDLLVDLDYEKGVGWQFYSWFEELEKIFAKKPDVISNVIKPEHLFLKNK